MGKLRETLHLKGARRKLNIKQNWFTQSSHGGLCQCERSEFCHERCMIACIAIYPHAIPVNIGLAHRPIALANHDEVHTAIWIIVIAEGFPLVVSKNIFEYDW